MLLLKGCAIEIFEDILHIATPVLDRLKHFNHLHVTAQNLSDLGFSTYLTYCNSSLRLTKKFQSLTCYTSIIINSGWLINSACASYTK